MSLSTLRQTSTSSLNFKTIIDAALSQALGEYKKKTGKDLLDNPLATEVQRCDSVDAILAIFQGQAKAFQQFKDGDQRLMKWISPVVDVLYRFSETLGGVAGMAFPPAGAIFTGIGILLAAAKDVRASHDALVELFERIESFFNRLAVYTQISLTTEMVQVFVKIVAEVLCVLSIATKEVKRTRARIYFGKLLGRTDIEDALKRLDNLIQEEVRMAIAQTMKAAYDLRGDSKKANDNIDKMKWNLIEQDVRKWFAPPDPSTNHNTACDVYHNAPLTWFFEAGIFNDWMSNGSLLWVHGKPGSGKSILCSAIIQHIMTLRDAGTATLAYFYFDFRDEEKQNVRDVVTSLLVQLSAYSKPCCDIVYRLYLTHGKGTQQPSDGILVECMKEMLTAATQHPIFVILDALDECPDSGLPTPREAVLNLVKDLVHLHLPNLHICVTSRLEVDVQTQLKPLAVNAISLDDESRQKMVIANYVSSVVSSDEHMRKWRDEDRKRVVDELSERADGMFQWVFFQFEILRHAAQPDLRGILEAPPRTLRLDETYERILKDIDKKNRKHAFRLLHCLAVAIRPLRVEELAEVLAFDFDGAQGGIPKFHVDWRPNDREGAILSTCSSLITIGNDRGSRVVRFSHLSVKEFLTSNHLASSTGDLSLYHILPVPAHTILAQVCLGALLCLNDRNYDKIVRVSPLAEYAARHWVAHAQFEDVASHVMDGMKSLFDPGKPHFAAWIGLFDIDAESSGGVPSEMPSPLYYAAFCGFHDLVRHLAIEHPQDINAPGGSYGFPLFAALCRNHIRIVEILLKHGGNVDVRDRGERTALHKTIDRDDNAAVDVVQLLLEHGTDVNAQRDDLWTPLHLAVNMGKLTVARMLLDNHADVNLRNVDGQTPLHLLLERELSQVEDDGCDLAKLLLERGANVKARDKNNATPLDLASSSKRRGIVQLLHNHSTNANIDIGETALHRVSCIKYKSPEDGVRIAQLLLECGVDVNTPRKNLWTPLHVASRFGKVEIARLLLDHGAKVDAVDSVGKTPLHDVSQGKNVSEEAGVGVARLLLERGADVNRPNHKQRTPLHVASYTGKLEIARLLLDHGAKVDAVDDLGDTPLRDTSQGQHDSEEVAVAIARLLSERGGDVNVQNTKQRTPLHAASYLGKLEITRLLLDLGAKVDVTDDLGKTPLYDVSQGKYVSEEVGVGVARLLLERGADVNRPTQKQRAPLHAASYNGKVKIARLLLDQGAKVDAMDEFGDTPLRDVSQGRHDSEEVNVGVARLLLECGGDVNGQNKKQRTPLHTASYFGKLEIVRLLLDHGAKVDAVDNLGKTPLHDVSQGKYVSEEAGVGVARLLLDRGGDVNAQNNKQRTPLHAASLNGRLEIARLLLDRGAQVDIADDLGDTPLRDVTQSQHDYEEAGVGIARLLLENGADVNGQNKKQRTPLHAASYYGKLEITRLLVNHAAKVHVMDNLGNTPLHDVSLEQGKHVSEEAGVGVARLLLDHGGNVNGQNKKQRTPLHIASFKGKLKIAQLLLDHGAKVDAVDDLGDTPLRDVSQSKHNSDEAAVGIARLLLQFGGDVNRQSKKLRTPLHSAAYLGKLEVVRLLLDHGAKADAVDSLGETPLHDVSQGKYESEEAGLGVAQLLLKHGAEVNTRAKSGKTPLDRISDKRPKLAQLLRRHGARPGASSG